MPNRPTRASRIAAAMEKCGIARDDGIAFGRPRVKGRGTPIGSLWGQFRAGETISSIADDFDMKPSEVENAIRFMALYPKADLPSFWEGTGL